MSEKWNPKLQAAYASSRTNFCVVLSELQYDDPFSAILYYDGTLAQPWGRVDVQREMTAIVAEPSTAAGAGAYVALSNEGEVYFNKPSLRQELIPGAGAQRPGGRGPLHALATYQGELLAVGTGGQIYRRHADSWVALDPKITPPAGYMQPGYAAVGVVDDELYLCGSVLADTQPYDVTRDPAYSDSMDVDALTQLFLKNANRQGQGPNPAGFAVHFDGARWLDLAMHDLRAITAVFAESRSNIWMVGPSGLILVGNAKQGFQNRSAAADRNLNFLSITKFKDRIILASDHGLHSFDGRRLSLIKPKLRQSRYPSVPTPVKVQAVGDVMFYFDYANHIHRWDGKDWEEIVIPPQLLERQFRGLAP